MMLMTLFPSSIEGLMGLWEEQPLSPSFKGLELSNESPPFKWEWFSEPLDCPPDERCKSESMAGTMSPLEGNPRPFQGGEEVSLARGIKVRIIDIQYVFCRVYTSDVIPNEKIFNK
ncbi:MAG: hypothetical protein RXR08_03265 [Sulfolobaceae archaeon]